MPVPLIGKEKYTHNPEVVRPQVFHEHKRLIGKAPDIRGAKSAVIYFDAGLHSQIKEKHLIRQAANTSLFLTDDNDCPIVLCKSPIGSPGAVTNLEELIALGVCSFISVGTAGYLQKEMSPASTVVCTGAYRDEGTSWHYLPDAESGEPGLIMADDFMRSKLADALALQNIDCVEGLSWTTDAPYRENANDIKIYRDEKHVMTVEMEASALIAVAQFRNVQLASAFVTSDLLTENNWKPLFHHEDLQPNLWRLFQAAMETLSAL